LLQRQQLDLVSSNGKQVVAGQWQSPIRSLIKLAAQDAAVTRIFVDPAIKQRLCLDAGADRNWLHKVRPWFGHGAHMHVRLRCPASSLECEYQDMPHMPPPGDGCGSELVSWFVPHQLSAKQGLPPQLPPTCQALLSNQFAAE